MSNRAGASKTTFQETRDVINQDGETISTEKTKVIQFPTEPPFVKVYIWDIAALLGLPGGAADLLLALLPLMGYEKSFILNSDRKRDIAAKIQIKVQTLNNYLQKLVDKQIISRIGRGEFSVNPNLIARGEWTEVYRRREDWELVLTYKPNGKRTLQGRPVKTEEND